MRIGQVAEARQEVEQRLGPDKLEFFRNRAAKRSTKQSHAPSTQVLLLPLTPHTSSSCLLQTDAKRSSTVISYTCQQVRPLLLR